MIMDISNFYLMTPLHRPKFIHMKLSDIPDEVTEEYKLREKKHQKWQHLHQRQVGDVRPTTTRIIGKRTPRKTFEQTRLPTKQIGTRPLEARHTVTTIHIGRGQLWSEIRWQETRPGNITNSPAMMPFVTEELWQRLPGRGTLGDLEPTSIMLAKFPQCNDAYRNLECEECMDATMNIVRACRSLRQQYSIANAVLTHFFVKVAPGKAEAAAKSQTDDIKTLGKAASVDINHKEDAISKSVGIVVVDEATTVLMDIKGLVDCRRHSAHVVIIQIILLAVLVFLGGQSEELDQTKAQWRRP